MLSGIVTQGVMAFDANDDEPGARPWPDESVAIGHVAEGRYREFTTARDCAQRALTALGRPRAPVLRGPSREPLWPEGVVGSITHCVGYRAAALALRRDYLSIGIDVEPGRVLPGGVVQTIASEAERLWMRSQPPTDVPWPLVLFSAKESVYKAWFPLTHRWLGFKDVAMTVDPPSGTFYARLLVDGPLVGNRPLEGFNGKFAHRGNRVVTFVGVPTRPGER